MNTEIEKFWIHSGYYIETDVLSAADMPYILFWFLMKNERRIRCVARSDAYDRNSEAYKQLKENPPCTVYFFGKNKYSETEMLKIVKMKTFI